MRLDQGNIHTSYQIIKLYFPIPSLQRLGQLGIYPGAHVQIEQITFQQGPRLLLLRGTMLMMRKGDCAQIEVEECL